MRAQSSPFIAIEGTDQVLVTGLIEDQSDQSSYSRGKIRLLCANQTFELKAAEGVEGLELLGSTKVSVLGIIDNSFPETPIIKVLGYRAIAPSPDTDGSGGNDTFRFRRRAA